MLGQSSTFTNKDKLSSLLLGMRNGIMYAIKEQITL
jgi:hypothetical protein